MRLRVNRSESAFTMRGHGVHTHSSWALEKAEDWELDGPKRGYCAALKEGAHLLKLIGDP